MRTASCLDRDRHGAGRTIFRDRSFRRRRLLHLVDHSDYEEDTKRDDYKVDYDRDEISIGKNWTEFFCLHQGQARLHLVRQRNIQITEVEISYRPADRRHQYVFDNRGDYFSKGSADNYADGEINCVAFDSELLEFLPHARLFS